MTTPKPQPYYARFTQPPRSPNGRNRQANPSNHSDPLDGTDPSTGRATPRKGSQSVWTTVNYPLPYPSHNTVGIAKLTADMQQAMINNAFSLFINPAIPPTIPYAGVTSGEITGYRGWVVTDEPEGPTLCSLAHRFLWQPNATIEGNLTECVNNHTFDPIFGGVYAFREFFGLLSEIDEANSAMWPVPREPSNWLGFAHGTVKLWGETIEHETGYRASFAKLTSLDGFIGVKRFDLTALRARYHV